MNIVYWMHESQRNIRGGKKETVPNKDLRVQLLVPKGFEGTFYVYMSGLTRESFSICDTNVQIGSRDIGQEMSTIFYDNDAHNTINNNDSNYVVNDDEDFDIEFNNNNNNSNNNSNNNNCIRNDDILGRHVVNSDIFNNISNISSTNIMNDDNDANTAGNTNILTANIPHILPLSFQNNNTSISIQIKHQQMIIKKIRNDIMNDNNPTQYHEICFLTLKLNNNNITSAALETLQECICKCATLNSNDVHHCAYLYFVEITKCFMINNSNNSDFIRKLISKCISADADNGCDSWTFIHLITWSGHFGLMKHLINLFNSNINSLKILFDCFMNTKTKQGRSVIECSVQKNTKKARIIINFVFEKIIHYGLVSMVSKQFLNELKKYDFNDILAVYSRVTKLETQLKSQNTMNNNNNININNNNNNYGSNNNHANITASLPLNIPATFNPINPINSISPYNTNILQPPIHSIPNLATYHTYNNNYNNFH